MYHDKTVRVFAPQSTSPRGSRFEVDVQVGFLRSGAFDTQNIITVSHAKFLRKLGELDSQKLSKVEDTLLFWLGFESENVNQEG
ncbi:type II toxin-antitoxin system PemK/MazF family toxin [Leptolyngbya sp. PCC 6406]|uniref:type II toxin-antitoxin system PemK/MazF family toxin n=1 Tax=Leptolyngbya sp. PCC 6406 TaxID=1173264 RepID=UPI001872D634|nr:type II toxin-antitoxin system PemK/MazF family toxin [Leptolyngbya sp. PCC 6406]